MDKCYPWTTPIHGQALSIDALTVIAEHCFYTSQLHFIPILGDDRIVRLFLFCMLLEGEGGHTYGVHFTDSFLAFDIGLKVSTQHESENNNVVP